MPGFRKRVYGSAFGRRPGRVSKRRRVTRRTRGRRNSKTSTITGQSGVAKSFGFRTRRVRPRTFRRMLWRDTLNSTHYRSAFDILNVNNAPATVTNANAALYQALPGNGFWLVTGGLQAHDTGVAPPTFTGDITIRGGLIRCALANESTADSVRVKVYLIWANKNPDPSKVVTGGALSTMADPSLFADFDEFGKVVMMREMTLLPLSNPVEIFHRLRVQKVDQGEYLPAPGPVINSGGSQFYWYVLTSKMSSVAGGTVPVRIVTSHNLSFSGDANT